MNQSTIAILILCATEFTSGCSSDSKCDPGQVLKDAVCVAEQAGASSTGGAANTGAGGTTNTIQGGDSSTAGGDSGSGGTSTVASSTVSTASLFGITCAADTDCTAPVGYCAKMPGATSGYCTQQSCITDPTICPANWTCFDLAALGVANGPNFCSKPSS